MRFIRFYNHPSVFPLVQLIGSSCWYAVLYLFLLTLPFISFASEIGNYMSSKEIEKVRNSQHPHKRMDVFNKIFKRRMEGAIASKTSENLTSKSFTGWMEEVIMCLEEIETNLENYPLNQRLTVWDLHTGKPIRMNRKKFQKSLKNILHSLLKFNKWLIKTLDHLNGFERKIAGETFAHVTDVTKNIKNIIEMAGGTVLKVPVPTKVNKNNNT